MSGCKHLFVWRLDQEKYAGTWDSGEGASEVGGRWNSPGRKVVYGFLDVPTAILEVAVHKGFVALNTSPHILTCFRIEKPAGVHIVKPKNVPDPNWLKPCPATAEQREFGDNLMKKHPVVAIPSVVSPYSWNLIMDVERLQQKPGKAYTVHNKQERYVLDSRLAQRLR